MRRFFKSFKYAYEGIAFGFRTEKKMLFHLIAAIVVIIVGMLTHLQAFEWFIILILISGMFSLELMNTAIENVVDLVTLEKHPLAKHAKDVAAGAVLIYAIVSAIIGFIIFIPKLFN